MGSESSLNTTEVTPVLGPSTQLGFVVRDLDRAVRHWVDVIGVAPFLFLDRGAGRPAPPAFHRGQEVFVETRLAFGYVGDVQLELIEQVNMRPHRTGSSLRKGARDCSISATGFTTTTRLAVSSRRPDTRAST